MNERLEDILHQVSKSPLIDNGDLLNAYRLVINSLHDALKIKRAGVWFVESNYSSISCQLLIDTYHNSEIEELVIQSHDYPAYFSALKSERAILANDAHTHQATMEFSEGYLAPLEITSMLDVPIRHKGKMIGIICCEHIGKQRQWSEDEATFAGSMADLIGRAINASAFIDSEQQLKEINEQLEDTVNERTKQLVESEKMAALGNLVAGIAHEVNTPLGISITASSSLSETLSNIEKSMNEGQLSEDVFKAFLTNSNKLLFLLESNLERAATLIKNFKQTAVEHTDTSQYIFDVTETIRHLIQSLHPEIKKHNVQVSYEATDNISIYSFPSAWSQIVTNLIMNSCTHAFADTDQPEINIKISIKGKYIHLTYQDNGCGIPENDLDKIILPFYTTKRGQGGTGLGMSIVYNLINEQLKGTMTLKNNDHSGVHINVTCPINNEII